MEIQFIITYAAGGLILLFILFIGANVQDRKIKSAIQDALESPYETVINSCDWHWKQFSELRVVEYKYLGNTMYYQIQGRIGRGTWMTSFKLQQKKPNFTGIHKNKISSKEEAIELYQTLRRFSNDS